MKREMSCPHSDKITKCSDCMTVLENMKNGIWPASSQVHEHTCVEGNTGYFCSECGERLGEYIS